MEWKSIIGFRAGWLRELEFQAQGSGFWGSFRA